ncbi:MAG: ATPase, partial [Catenulispora sp.]|nr:ATPase [Catenulispora sp.]
RVSADEVVASLVSATPTPRTLPKQQDGGQQDGASQGSRPSPSTNQASAHR